jgi:hypothetical protein
VGIDIPLSSAASSARSYQPTIVLVVRSIMPCMAAGLSAWPAAALPAQFTQL